jgi:hypothetical protein
MKMSGLDISGAIPTFAFCGNEYQLRIEEIPFSIPLICNEKYSGVLRFRASFS